MKNLAKVLTLILAVSFMATGCDLLNKEEPISQTAEVVSADTILDQQIYQRAIDSKDVKVCETITDKAVKAECGDVVNALVLTDKAVSELDDDFCGDIKLERYEEECEARVASILEQQEAEEKKQEEIAKQEEERLNIEQEAVTKGDYTICDKISDENQKASCKYNSITPEVIKANDTRLCDKIENEWMVNQCKQLIKE